MTGFRVSAATLAVVLLLQGAAAWAQSEGFDDRRSGFLTVPTGGMPSDAWGSTSLATAKRLVSGLLAAPRSRSLRDLQFKVMVSDLVTPANDGSAPPSLFRRKVDRLAAMGEGESLNEMVRTANAYSDPEIAATVVNSMMLVGERAGACDIVAKHPLTQPFGHRAEIACKLVNGDNAGALAAVEALTPQDKALSTLVQVAAGGLPPTAALQTPLDGPAVVMLNLAHVPPPAAALHSTQPAMIRAMVGQRVLPIATRIDIAERGEALAIIEATRLGDLYAEALKEGAPLPPAMARRARLVVATRDAANAEQIMSSIAAVYAETRGSPLFPTLARASATALLNLPAKPEYANVAQEAMRGFLLLGDKQLALAWTRLALQAAYNNARAMMALDRLMPLVMIAGVDKVPDLDKDDVNRWYEVIRQDDARAAPLRGYLLLQLFRATGYDLARGATALPETPPPVRLVSPPAATLQALQAAARDRRRAEASLLAASAIAETPLTDLHPAAVGTIVKALRDVGEDQAARLFAIEVAIAHGL
jgi:hypothetical protein